MLFQRDVHQSLSSDDADVFVLLVHYYDRTNCKKLVLMEETHGARNVIDIGQTVGKHSHLAATLPALHALTGCDSTSKFHGIGKKTALNISKKAALISMGLINSKIEDVVQEATQFIGLCYGITEGADMTSKRYMMCIKKYFYQYFVQWKGIFDFVFIPLNFS